MAYDKDDFKYIVRLNSSKKDKKYRCTCKTCNRDRGYLSKCHSDKNCKSCRSKETFAKLAADGDQLQSGKDGNRRKYLVCCPKCGENRGYRRKRDFNRLCVRCGAKETGIKLQKTPEEKRKTKSLYIKRRRQVDINYKLRKALRSRLWKAINNNQKMGSAVKDLGCTIDELKIYLESKFQPGMTWENWSKDGWHIDHMCALVNFDLSDPEQLKKACNYKNLQPLWAEDHKIKTKKDILGE